MAHPGCIGRRGTGKNANWQVKLRVAGVRYTYGPRTEGFPPASATRRQVEEWAWKQQKALEKAAEREREGLAGRVRFSALLVQFREEELPVLAPGTRRSYEESLRPIEGYFVTLRRDPYLDELRARHVRAYLAWRRVNRRDGAAPLANRTLAKDRAVLHRIFAVAERLELRDGNPVARVEAPKHDPHQPVLLTDEQYEALIRECYAHGPMLGLYALLLGETGTRAYTEALQLRWEDVHLAEGFLFVASRPGARTKSGKGRWTPLTARLAAALRDHFAQFRLAAYRGVRPEYVFHHTRPWRTARAGDRVGSFRKAFDSAGRRAGLPAGFRRHDLRHRRVTSWLADGADVVLVKEAVGHADLRTTMGYTHLAREHLRRLVEPAPPAADPRVGGGAPKSVQATPGG
jgi:site-specific recombinase XerD